MIFPGLTRTVPERSSMRPIVRGLALGALAIIGCSPNGVPCSAPNCAAGYECLANTCTPLGADPVPKDTTRIVVEPVSVAAVGIRKAGGGAVAFGNRSGAALYLRFDTSWRTEGSVARAFLLLEPSPSTERAPDDLPLDVWTIQSPWTPMRIADGNRPNLGLPRARGLIRSSPPATARIDVTGLALAMGEGRIHEGIAVLGAASGDAEISVQIGSAGGAPRLELYLRPSR